MANFLTVNLNSILNKNNSKASSGSVADKPSAELEQHAEGNSTIDWENELKTRLAKNKALDTDTRENEYDIENKFFTEYFKANWSADCADALITMGEPLKKALKVLGFDKNTNPILAFISTDYATSAGGLITTGLLNESTFKAIYNAVAKKLIAASEFFGVNDYNIIYCKDLYKKPLAEIMKYLELQSKILLVSASEYTDKDVLKNKRVFAHIASDVNEKNPIKRAEVVTVNTILTKLNNLEDAEQIYNSKYSSLRKLATDEQNTLVSSIKTPAEILAAIQFLSMTTNSGVAKKALSTENFDNISGSELAKASVEIYNIMPKDKLTTDTADTLAGLLLKKLG